MIYRTCGDLSMMVDMHQTSLALRTWLCHVTQHAAPAWLITCTAAE